MHAAQTQWQVMMMPGFGVCAAAHPRTLEGVPQRTLQLVRTAVRVFTIAMAAPHPAELVVEGVQDSGFFDWRQLFPSLQALLEAAPAIAAELAGSASAKWHDWPETALYMGGEGETWRVIPFCYTYPADGSVDTQWVASSSALLPVTSGLLRGLGPSLRTALFSRLGPGTALAPHDGWAELSNHVLRCHLSVSIPSPGTSGVAVEGLRQLHAQGGILCFDDSRVHSGFNEHPTAERTVLIVDMARPQGVRPGRATMGATRELTTFMSHFA